MGSSKLKCDGIKEVKIWRHKGRQLWWESWRISSCIDIKCNTCTDWTVMLCLTDYYKLKEELGFKEGASFGLPECSIESLI